MARALLIVLSVSAGLARADYMDHFVQREDVGPRKVPYLGDAQLVLIPVEVAGFPPLDRARLEGFFSPEDPVGFVRYFETVSLGRYHPRVTVAPTVNYATCPLPAAQFPTCEVARGDINAFTAGMDMMRDVVRRTRDAGFSFAGLDVNGRRGTADGWIDGVMVLTNVPFGGIAFPFAFFNRGDNLAGGTSGPLVVDGIKLPHFAIAGEGDVHVMVHEFGHLLGLTDLYDESGRYDGLHLSFMGAWTYQPQIPLPDAETRWRLRWANWHQVQGRQRVRVRPAETSGDVYRLGIGDEYFLVENRGPGGAFDGDVPERGLAVFHVDRAVKLGGTEGDFVSRLLDCVNCDPWHPYIRLVQADGRFELERGQRVAAGDLFRDGAFLRGDARGIGLSLENQVNSTNRYSGELTGLQLEDVRVLADGSIDVTLIAPEAGQCDERLCAEGEGCAPVSCGESNAPPPGCAVTWGPAMVLLAVALAGRRRVSAS